MACHAGGRGFEPRRSRHDFNDLAFRVRFCDTFGPAPVTLFVGFSFAPGLLSGPINGSYTFYVNWIVVVSHNLVRAS
jgi:hypothetical protein